MKKLLLLILYSLVIVQLTSCAQGPDPGSTQNSTGNSGNASYVQFLLKINDAGKLNSQGYYVILFNSEVQPIEATNAGTFTDGIRMQIDPNFGPQHYWFHRIPSVPGPGYDLVLIARVDEYAQISSDWRTVTYTFKLDDSSVIFNQYIFSRFTAHAMTTDIYMNSVLGRVIDCMGPGPDISQNSQYTVYANRYTGVENPRPPSYPVDPLYDWCTINDLPVDFPYFDYDIETFQVNTF